MTTKLDINSLPMGFLVRIYNNLDPIPARPVKKFESLRIAQSRVIDALGKREVHRLANGNTPVGVNLKSAHVLWNNADGEFVITYLPLSTEAKSAPKAKAPVAAKKSRATFGEDEVIAINTAIVTTAEGEDGSKAPTTRDNPKRAGSRAAARLQILIDAGQMTVGQYLDACVALEGKNALPRFKYRVDLQWNLDHGFMMFPNGAKD